MYQLQWSVIWSVKIQKPKIVTGPSRKEDSIGQKTKVWNVYTFNTCLKALVHNFNTILWKCENQSSTMTVSTKHQVFFAIVVRVLCVTSFIYYTNVAVWLSGIAGLDPVCPH